MTTIDIKESLWSDPRFIRLCIKLESELLAVGAVVLAWKQAQKFWIPNQEWIPAKNFREAEIPMALIEVGLADINEHGDVYVRGSREHFQWWFDAREKGRLGGQKSAEKRRERTVNPPLTPPQPPVKGTQPLTLLLKGSNAAAAVRDIISKTPLLLEKECVDIAKTHLETSGDAFKCSFEEKCDNNKPNNDITKDEDGGGGFALFTSDIPANAMAAWKREYGGGFVDAHLPRAWGAWESNPNRQGAGKKALFIRSFLEKEKNGTSCGARDRRRLGVNRPRKVKHV